MNKCCVFAHYDKDNIIADYVIYYLKGLKEICNQIVFVSDCNLPPEELNKISDIVSFSIAEKHQEYDFGSYKRGFLYLKDNGLLSNTSQLIFANDSCYAPLFNFSEMFNKMNNKNLDFWGATTNHFGIKREGPKLKQIEFFHVQSYFIVFNKNVFMSECFIDFMKKIKKQPTKEDVVINYEMGLSSLLEKQGFKFGAYYPGSKNHSNMPIVLWDKMILNKFPFVKTSILRMKNLAHTTPFFWKILIGKNTKYPTRHISSDLKRYDLKLLSNLLFWLRGIIRKVIRIHFKTKKVFFKGKWLSISKKQY